MRGVSAYQPCICYRLPVNERIYSASLREGGGEHSEPGGAGDINAYHSPQKKHFSFIHAGSSHRYRGPPSSRRRALSLKHPTLTFCFFFLHRHSLFPTTRLSRGFRFTIKRIAVVCYPFFYPIGKSVIFTARVGVLAESENTTAPHPMGSVRQTPPSLSSMRYAENAGWCKKLATSSF